MKMEESECDRRPIEWSRTLPKTSMKKITEELRGMAERARERENGNKNARWHDINFPLCLCIMVVKAKTHVYKYISIIYAILDIHGAKLRWQLTTITSIILLRSLGWNM